MELEPQTRSDEGTSTSVATHFDRVSLTRNEVFQTHPVLEYEQEVRSNAVLALLDPQHGERILDVGCGNARDLLPILEGGATIVGIDLSPGMLDQARRELPRAALEQVTLELGDATRLRFAPDTFDKVLCSEVIEHIPNAAAAAREMLRVLKPGGVLVMSTPNPRSLYGADRFVVERVMRRRWNHPYDHWRSPRQLRALLEGAGFRVEQVRTDCYVPGFLVPYFLPSRALKRALVAAVRAVAPLARALAPGSGYEVIVRAIKPA